MQRIWLTRALLHSEALTWNHFGSQWACRRTVNNGVLNAVGPLLVNRKLTPVMHSFKITSVLGNKVVASCHCKTHDTLPASTITVTHLLDPLHGHLSVPSAMLYEYRIESGGTLMAPSDLRFHDIILALSN
jgi:hypothetical protein